MTQAASATDRTVAAHGAVRPADASHEAVERMRLVNPGADPATRLPDVPPARIPRHIAVIMDGNGRWAEERGRPRVHGHRAGAEAIRRTIEECGRLGVECLTLYSFSSENWKRPREEVEALMGLSLEYMRAERDNLARRNIRFRPIGRREGLPAPVLEELDQMVEATSHCTGPTLCVAMNYGGRSEITDAVRAIAERIRAGEIDPADVRPDMIESSLYTAGLPELDLLIRTGGEMRISNFLLWQVSYAEIHVTPAHWPDFGEDHLHEAVRDFASRRRRFGGVESSGAAAGADPS